MTKEYISGNFMDILNTSFKERRKEIEEAFRDVDYNTYESLLSMRDNEFIEELQEIVDTIEEAYLKELVIAIILEYQGIVNNSSEGTYIKEADYEDEVVIKIGPKKDKIISVSEASDELKESVKRNIELQNLENVDHISYKILNDMSILELAESVYGSEEYWIAIYEYGNNKDIINEMMMEVDLPLEELVGLEGFFNGETFMIPRKVKKDIVKNQEKRI